MSRHRGNGDDDDGRSMAGNASTAQLNSWTETMKKQKPSGRRPPHPQRERGEAHYDEHDRNLNTYSSTAQLNQWTESQRNKQKKSGASSLESSDNEGGRIDGKMSESSSVERLNNWTSSVRAGGKGDKRLGGGEVGIEYDDEFAHQAREMRSDSSTERLQEWTSSMKVPGKGNIGGGELGVEYDDEFAVQARQIRSNSSLERLQEWTSEQQQAKAGGGQQRVIEPEEYEMMNREMRSNSSTERFETWTSSQKKEKEHREAKQQQRGRGGDEGEEEEEEEAGGDYDDDGFEDYDDEDFEDDEEESPSKAPPKQQQGAGGASNASGSKAAAKQAQLRQQQQAAASASNAAAADPKHKSSSQQPPSRGAKGSSSGASSRPKKFENMQISFSPSTMTDPRGVRVKRLLDSGVMELQLERATHWQVLPITPYELYLNKLRLNPSNVRQVGVPSDLERRDVDSNTDIIETQDCSVQFSYGDDTAFYEVLAEITRRRGHNSKSKTSTGSGADAKGEGGATGTDVSLQDIARGKSTAAAGDEGNPGAVSTPAATTLAAAASSADNSSGATRLTTFLQRASLLCEAVLQDQDDRAMLDQQQQNNGDDDSRHGDAKSTTRGGGVSSSSSLPVLDTQSDWVTLGQDMSRGGNETVRTRRIAAVRFSPLQPHLILSAHPFPTLDRDGADAVEMDLKPYKGLYCVWDVANPGGPAFVLEGTGQPVCCCFSATQPHLLLGATQEGTLHLWDLREHAAIHKDRDAVDLQIDKGIRKPCYSTNLSFPAVEGDGSDGRYGVGSGAYHGGAVEDDPSGAGWQHSSPVVQVESLTLGGGRGGGGGGAGAVGGGAATGAAAVSQFVSIDEAGLMIFWITSQQKQQQSQLLGGNGAAGGGGEDLQRSPWAGVMLVQTRQIHTHSHSLYHPIGVGVHQAATTTHGPRGAAAAGGGGGGGFIGAGGGAVLQGTVVLAPIPDDLSTLLVSGDAGEVARVSRFSSSSSSSSHPTSNNDNNNGNSNTKQQQLAQYATTPQLLRRVRVSSGLDVSMITSQDADAKGISNSSINSNAGHPQELSLFSAVSCMSVRENVYIPNSNSNSSVEGGSSDAEGGASSSAAAATTQHQQAEAGADAKEDSAGGNRTSNRSGSAASSNSSSRASLILVGRFDGTLDLFQVDVEHPIQSWNLNEFMKTTNGTGIGRAGSSAATGLTSASRVVMVQWCSSRAGVFFAANKAGCLFHFNLLQNMAAPVHVAPLEVAHKLRSRHSIDVSRVRPGTGAFYVTVMSSSSHSSSGGGGGGGDDSGDVLYARRGSARLAKCMPNQLIQEEVQLRASLHQLSAKRCETPSVMYLPPSKHHTPLVNDSKS